MGSRPAAVCSVFLLPRFCSTLRFLFFVTAALRPSFSLLPARGLPPGDVRFFRAAAALFSPALSQPQTQGAPHISLFKRRALGSSRCRLPLFSAEKAAGKRMPARRPCCFSRLVLHRGPFFSCGHGAKLSEHFSAAAEPFSKRCVLLSHPARQEITHMSVRLFLASGIQDLPFFPVRRSLYRGG